jgi:nicotinate-nucleotide pyrophosphorylase (carboxylating)
MIIDAHTKKIIQQALLEDIGAKDITTSSVIDKRKSGDFVITSKQDAVLCGMNIVEAAFEAVDSSVRFKPLAVDGTTVVNGKAVAYVEGACLSVLSAERTALNFLSWLSGIATLTSRFVDAVKHTRAKIMDTRKTIPTLRRLQKYAVKIGGGINHRTGLYDQVLIKDNHISLALTPPTVMKGKKEAIGLLLKNARVNAGKGKLIEIEVDSLEMLEAALRHDPDIIMLDNMGVEDIQKAVSVRDAYRIKVGDIGFKVLLEASGNINLGNVKQVAECGVDRISIGALTHSASSADFSLEVR